MNYSLAEKPEQSAARQQIPAAMIISNENEDMLNNGGESDLDHTNRKTITSLALEQQQSRTPNIVEMKQAMVEALFNVPNFNYADGGNFKELLEKVIKAIYDLRVSSMEIEYYFLFNRCKLKEHKDEPLYHLLQPALEMFSCFEKIAGECSEALGNAAGEFCEKSSDFSRPKYVS